MTDYFDTKNICDLSDKVKQELKINKVHLKTRKLLKLFEIKKSLTKDEIIVGFYRVHGISVKRTWLTATLYNLCKRGILKKNKENGEFYR
jgi:hypothetical protein